jgi:hypothetical protein
MTPTIAKLFLAGLVAYLLWAAVSGTMVKRSPPYFLAKRQEYPVNYWAGIVTLVILILGLGVASLQP